MTSSDTLVLIKVLHTAVWALMVGVILVIPCFMLRRKWRLVWILESIVLLECAVLALNGMRCPLTDVAARYSTDRPANFDIYLPVWLAANNKLIFGTLFWFDTMWAGFAYWRSRQSRRSRFVVPE